MPPILSVSRLKKRYSTALAVDGISFEVRPREIVGLLGPNGAGKTTTISMVLGILSPTEGEIAIEGVPLARERSRALSHTNFSAVYAPLPGNLAVEENLYVFGLLYGVPNLRQRVEELLKEFDLVAFRRTKSGALSSGEQARVGLAKAMLNRPRLLLLDEPTASLDPSVARHVRARIREFVTSGAGSVLWTSHNMHEVAEVCDRVIVMSHGRVLLEGDPRTLPARYGHKTLEDLFVAVAREPLCVREEGA